MRASRVLMESTNKLNKLAFKSTRKNIFLIKKQPKGKRGTIMMLIEGKKEISSSLP